MTLTVSDVHAVEILDSRARPTLAVTLTSVDGVVVRAGVPSGASTGSREAKELRDGDKARFGGQGVRCAAAGVNGEIASALRGGSFKDLATLDTALIELDGTENKSRLGANAIVGVSMAAARAFSVIQGVPLWRTFVVNGATPQMPVPTSTWSMGVSMPPTNWISRSSWSPRWERLAKPKRCALALRFTRH
jgi:enolase